MLRTLVTNLPGSAISLLMPKPFAILTTTTTTETTPRGLGMRVID
jgi:hypothetical protein